jgi:molybdopterin-guanine dinucleotide biosynthesis protein A
VGFSGIVLAGGRAVRMDGADKASVEYLGRTLLEHAIDALVDADEVVVVGDPVRTTRPVTFTREDPRYGGPVAALLTGLDALERTREQVVVVAVDMPLLSHRTVRRLRESVVSDGSVLVGPDGRRQLALVLRTDRLGAVRPGHEEQHGMALHRLLAGLDLAEVAAEGAEARDVDSWADLRDL